MKKPKTPISEDGEENSRKDEKITKDESEPSSPSHEDEIKNGVEEGTEDAGEELITETDYSTDDGKTFHPATEARGSDSEGLTNLSSATVGIETTQTREREQPDAHDQQEKPEREQKPEEEGEEGTDIEEAHE